MKEKYHQKVSHPTIIHRAKTHAFYLRKPKKSSHDREVLTNYVGELIQHDSSYHLRAPASQEKCYLITSLDDYSRMILYATMVKTETAGPISLPYRISFSKMDSRMPTMLIPTVSSDLSRGETPSGENIIF